MHRTTATLKRPEPHVFVDSGLPPDHRGERTCGAPHCGLPERNTLHVEPADLYEPAPPEAVEIDHRRIGESE
jgi:hypothetical protein